VQVRTACLCIFILASAEQGSTAHHHMNQSLSLMSHQYPQVRVVGTCLRTCSSSLAAQATVHIVDVAVRHHATPRHSAVQVFMNTSVMHGSMHPNAVPYHPPVC
jgi:hypothetical protein